MACFVFLWVPAFAGITAVAREWLLLRRNDVRFAGMTAVWHIPPS